MRLGGENHKNDSENFIKNLNFFKPPHIPIRIKLERHFQLHSNYQRTFPLNPYKGRTGLL